jgi:hypothetical protein
MHAYRHLDLLLQHQDETLAAVAWANHRQGGVIRSSSPRLLAGASVVEARWLDAVVEQLRRASNAVERGVGKAGGMVEVD